MNKKLVIVWVGVIVTFILIGIYGLSNVDRLVDDGAGGKIFLGSDEHLRKCTYNTPKSNITYTQILLSSLILFIKLNQKDLKF